MDTMEDLRKITDYALRTAKAALTAGWERISSTDIARGHGQEVGLELGALTLPAGICHRALRRHDVTDIRTRIRNTAAEAADWRELADDADKRRDDLIRAALADGVSVGEVVNATGLSRARIYQIRDGRR